MTQPTYHSKFLLKKGLQYTRCNYSERCDGTESLLFTKENYIVELVVQRNPDGTPRSATAYMPDEEACLRRLPGSRECQLDLLFEGDQLPMLISSSPQTFSVSPPPAVGKEKPSSSLTPGHVGNLPPPKPPATTDLLLPALMAGLLGGAAFAAIQSLLTLLLKRKRDQKTSRVSNDLGSRETGRRSELSESDRIAREVQKQLFFTRQQVQDLYSKVSELDNRLIEQYQNDQAPSINSPLVPSIAPNISFTAKKPDTYLPSLPPPLTIETIKQAVLDWNYHAIASYQFDFTSETIQSQKGEVDIKSFSIDGNQDQSDSRSQSEFIAISCQEVTYLIPNILQNAGDPALTISRHLKRIYKKGEGSELKNLAKLAIVRKTGNCYELVEMGQVA